MENIVFLNSGKIDFDKKLDLSCFENLGTVTKYDSSTNDEILERVNNQNVVISKELPLEEI